MAAPPPGDAPRVKIGSAHSGSRERPENSPTMWCDSPPTDKLRAETGKHVGSTGER